jgi:hypothetical protein
MLLRVEAPPAAETCPVTMSTAGWYGNGLLSTRLPRDGILAGRGAADGSISWKFSWSPRGIDPLDGEPTVQGQRLDAPSPPMRVLAVRWGYSSTGRGRWATAVVFPSEGCWRMTARMRDVSLTFALRVVRG